MRMLKGGLCAGQRSHVDGERGKFVARSLWRSFQNGLDVPSLRRSVVNVAVSFRVLFSCGNVVTWVVDSCVTDLIPFPVPSTRPSQVCCSQVPVNWPHSIANHSLLSAVPRRQKFTSSVSFPSGATPSAISAVLALSNSVVALHAMSSEIYKKRLNYVRYSKQDSELICGNRPPQRGHHNELGTNTTMTPLLLAFPVDVLPLRCTFDFSF